MNQDYSQAVNVLKNGGVIAYPTDTTFGIGCDVSNAAAVMRIFEIKGRNFDKPLSIACSSIEMLRRYALINALSDSMLSQFYPGPVTLLLHKPDLISDTITSGSKKVGVRIPNHRHTLDMIEALGRPIITTSANLSGQPEPVHSSDIALPVDFICPGECDYNQASTIIDIENKNIVRCGVNSDKYQQLIDRILNN